MLSSSLSFYRNCHYHCHRLRNVPQLGRAFILSGLAARGAGELIQTLAIVTETHTHKVSWADARVWCSSRGMSLISLETLNKADHFLNLVSTIIIIQL